MAIFALNIWYRTVGDDRDYYGEKVVDLMDGQAVFPGQQDGERILYVIRVHPLLLVFRLLRGVILFALFCAACPPPRGPAGADSCFWSPFGGMLNTFVRQ
jgi:hypothetical protein